MFGHVSKSKREQKRSGREEAKGDTVMERGGWNQRSSSSEWIASEGSSKSSASWAVVCSSSRSQPWTVEPHLCMFSSFPCHKLCNIMLTKLREAKSGSHGRLPNVVCSHLDAIFVCYQGTLRCVVTSVEENAFCGLECLFHHVLTILEHDRNTSLQCGHESESFPWSVSHLLNVNSSSLSM
jgi:hypothetical protein